MFNGHDAAIGKILLSLYFINEKSEATKILSCSRSHAL